jgi:hypothetical protein
MLAGKLWLFKVFLFTLIGFFGSIPPEFERGKIFNAVFEASFTVSKDLFIKMALTGDLENPYTHDFDGFAVSKNQMWQDKKLEKRKVLGRIAFVFFLIIIFAAIAVTGTVLSNR